MKKFSENECSRRDFVKRLSAGCLGVTTTPIAFANAKTSSLSGPSAKNIIYLYMSGGMSHLDTFDLKQKREVQGPVEGIRTNVTGLYLSEYLPKLATQMDKMAVINSMFSNQGAHLEGRYYMHSSYIKRGTIQHPGIGSWLLKFDGRHNPTLPGAVHIGDTNPGSGQGFLEQKFAPLLIGDPETGLQHSRRKSSISASHFEKSLVLKNKFDQKFYEKYQAKQVKNYAEVYDDAIKLMKSRDLEAFDLHGEPKALRDAYGNNEFGQGCLLARRLIENDVRLVEVTLGGWDTHTNNFERVAENARILDAAMSSLLIDLDRRGLLNETLVVLTTEFGRSPKINANEGRDHSPTAFSSVLAGGGVQGGHFYGKSDEIGKTVDDQRVVVPDFNATLAYALGLPLDKTVHSASGRPFTIADRGQPLTALF